MLQTAFDAVPSWLVFVGTIVAFLAASEVGVWLGRRRGARAGDEDLKSHAGTVLTALLALLGLLLAFSFSIVETRFLERKQLVLDEANAIGTTYLRAQMLPSPYAERTEALLRRYVRMRSPRSPTELQESLQQSEAIHERLWRLAESVSAAKPDPITALFVQTLNDLIDLHEKRVTVAMHQRLPSAILMTLYVVAILAMASVGYSAALSGSRTRLPTVAVIAAIAVVLILIVELDRPWQNLITVNQQALQDVQETMHTNGRAPAPPGNSP